MFCCINLLLTEREGRTGEYWPEVVAVRTERSEVPIKTTEGQYSPVRFEQARLVSSLWMLLKRGMGNGEWGMGNGMIPGNGK